MVHYNCVYNNATEFILLVFIQEACAARQKHLTVLVTFMRKATQELIWMNQKEETELSRDWSSPALDVTELEEYRKVILPVSIFLNPSKAYIKTDDV